MPWYWVSYSINDRDTGGMTGVGAVDVYMDGPPLNVNDVHQLADRITDAPQVLTALGDRRHVSVQSWSPMGGTR